MKNVLLWAIVMFILIFAGNFIWHKITDKSILEKPYAPEINPADFSTTINNPFFTLTPGTQFVLESYTAEGLEHTEVTVLPETRVVMGVNTVVVHDQVFLNGALLEDTRDWYAQDSKGNVWYFGEETAEYENGQIVNTEGSWEAGVDGALPGIAMKANPEVGDEYRQEYYKDQAEDVAEVVSVDESVKVPFGLFKGCIKTFDYTPLDPEAQEYKYYCKEAGFVTFEVDIPADEYAELLSVTGR